MYDVVIIGAGAAGVMCSLILKKENHNLKMLLLEKNDKLGKKLSITGNGKCNLGNLDSNINNYYSNSRLDKFKKLIENKNFDFLNVINNVNDSDSYYNYLNNFGILIKEEEKRLYPYSMQALSVCKSFERYLSFLNVEVRYGYDVKDVIMQAGNFVINDELISKKVVVATGGKSYPKTGSTGKGYEVLKEFGHTVTKLYPSLTSLKTDYKYIKDLAGVRANAFVSLSVNGSVKETEEGQVQFTKEALSGVCVFNLSINVSKYLDEKKTVKLIIDLIPEYSGYEIFEYLNSFPSYTVDEALSCVVNNKIAYVVAKEQGVYGKKVKALSKNELEKVCFYLKNIYFNITGTGDFENAQVTSGGVMLDEFTSGLESTKCKGLYVVGEVLDVAGKCGGYNLSWAFTSALVVAKDIIKQ